MGMYNEKAFAQWTATARLAQIRQKKAMENAFWNQYLQAKKEKFKRNPSIYSK